MLLKKIDQGKQFLEEHGDLFSCPKCRKAMINKDYSLICRKQHRFDLAKKGTINFINHQIKTDYDKEMLSHRQKMIQIGLYEPLIQRILEASQDVSVESVVDIGCGEGSFLKELTDKGLEGTKIGFDISKDGVALATSQDIDAFWCVADITTLPFADQSMTHLLNIFSPSHYEEFRRVLKPGGRLIKVVPEENYLKEMREVFYQDDKEKQTYSNEKVVTKFKEEMTLISQERLTYQVPVPTERQEDLLAMSPLKWGASPESLKKAQETPIEFITVDVLVLIGE